MNMFAYCGNDPINAVDPTGHEWWHWAIAAAVVVVAAAAVVVTAGGAAAGVAAVASVSSGFAAATTASTVAAGAFIGSSATLGTSAMFAASTSNSIQDFNDQGSWGTVTSTIGGGVIGSVAGFSQSRTLKQKNNSSPISNSDAKRIQNAANKTNQTITVVGSRAKGTAGLNSDWDYIMSGNSAQRHAAASSVPRGVFGGEYNSGIDIFSSYPKSPYPVMLNKNLPYITFYPRR